MLAVPHAPSRRLAFPPCRIRRLPLGLAAVALALLAACGGDAEQPRLAVEPVVDLPDSVALGQPLHISYTWKTGEEFAAPAHDYKAFVHFRNPEGRNVFQDDHYPPTPTSQWGAEDPSYSHWIYPPELYEFEYLDVFVGLYDPDDGKVAVRAGDRYQDTPGVKRMHIRAEDLSGLPVFGEGWYPEEVVGDGPYERWHWTQERAEVMFVNPRGPAILHLRAHSPVEEIGGPQRIEIRVGDGFTYSIVNSDPEPLLDRTEIPAEAFGEEDWVPVTITVDPAFEPTQADPDSTDTRTLGLQVFTLYLGPASGGQ